MSATPRSSRMDQAALRRRKRELEDACGGAELSMLDVFEAPENPLPVLQVRILPLCDYTRIPLAELDFTPEWLKLKRKAPELLREWLRDHAHPAAVERDQRHKSRGNKRAKTSAKTSATSEDADPCTAEATRNESDALPQTGTAEDKQPGATLRTEPANSDADAARTKEPLSKDPELAALERLLIKFGSLSEAEAAMLEQEAARRSAQAREARFRLDPLLRRYRLVNMTPQQLQVLVIALQNELAACQSFLQGCNVARHPLLQAALALHMRPEDEKVFAAAPEPAHLIDIAELHLFARDTRRGSDIAADESVRGLFDSEELPEEDNVAFQRRQNTSIREQLSWFYSNLAQIRTRIVEMDRSLARKQQQRQRTKHRRRSRQPPHEDSRREAEAREYDQDDSAAASGEICDDDDLSVMHPAARPTAAAEAEEITLLERQTRSLRRIQDDVGRMQSLLNRDVAKLQREIESRDELIEMQQDIELKLVKSKRETAATNVQLASLVMRMIYHVYPHLWEKLAQDANVEPDGVLQWEEENSAWLKRWMRLVAAPERSEDPEGDEEVHAPSPRASNFRAMQSESALAGSRSHSHASRPQSMESSSASLGVKRGHSSSSHEVPREDGLQVRASTYVFRVPHKAASPQLQQQPPPQKDLAATREMSPSSKNSWMQDCVEKEKRASAKAQENLRQRVRQVISAPPDKAVAGLLEGLVRSVLEYSPILGAAPSPAVLMDRLQEFAFDVSMIPNLLTQHKIGCAFGLAWAKSQTLERLEDALDVAEPSQDPAKTDTENKEKGKDARRARNVLIVRYWLEECARLAFGKSSNAPVAWAKGLAQHIQTRMNAMTRAAGRAGSAMSPRRPQTAKPARSRGQRPASKMT